MPGEALLSKRLASVALTAEDAAMGCSLVLATYLGTGRLACPNPRRAAAAGHRSRNSSKWISLRATPSARSCFTIARRIGSGPQMKAE